MAEINEIDRLRAKERELIDTIEDKQIALDNMENTLARLTGQTQTWRDEIELLR